MDIKAEIGRHTDEAEQIITSYLPEEKGYQKTVIEAMNYSFLAGGKRLRPILMLETYRLFGGKSKVIEPFMAAIEMIHTYSLVHDDLPAMDNDEWISNHRIRELEKQSVFCLQKREFMEWSADRQWMLSLRIPVI